MLDVQYGVTPKNSIKEAVEFCLANKSEPLPADKAADKGVEAAAAAPAEPTDEELEKEQDAAPEPETADKAEDDTQAADDEELPAAEGAAAMDVDGAAAAEDEAKAPEQEEEKVSSLPGSNSPGAQQHLESGSAVACSPAGRCMPYALGGQSVSSIVCWLLT